MGACPFCFVSSERIIREAENAIAFFDARAGKSGYATVAPRRHVGSSELSREELNEMGDLLKRVRGMLKESTGGDGIGYDQQSQDEEVGHACVQLVPRLPPSDASGIQEQLKQAGEDFAEIGGWHTLQSGEWLWSLIQKSFRSYWERANVGYFEKKYRTHDKNKIAEKLIKVAAHNSALLGAVVGAAVSTDEAVAILTGGLGGVGLPANIAIAVAAIGSETILLTRLQLQLIANLGQLYGVPLNADDPEDILAILAFALGGAAAEAAGIAGMKVGGTLTKGAIRGFVNKELLQTLKDIGKTVGVKVLQRSIVKYTVPLASMVIGSGWNYWATRAVGKIAQSHFRDSALLGSEGKF